MDLLDFTGFYWILLEGYRLLQSCSRSYQCILIYVFEYSPEHTMLSLLYMIVQRVNTDMTDSCGSL